MTACERYREQISAELDGALGVEEVRDLATHLARCGACAAARADYAEVGAAFAGGPAAAAPGPGTWAEIDRYVSGGARAEAAAFAAADPAPVPARRSWARAGARAAAVLAIAGAAFAAGRASAPVPGPSPIPAPAVASRDAEEAAIGLLADALFAGDETARGELGNRLKGGVPR